MAAGTLKERSAGHRAEVSALGLYERDLHAWTRVQAEALRAGRLDELDRENLAEEIESLGREQFAKLRSAFRIILVHMLKWHHQPERRSRSWTTSIRTQRAEIADIVEENPSLASRRNEAAAAAYRRARIEAAGEMDRPERDLPPENPYTLDEILDRPFQGPGG